LAIALGGGYDPLRELIVELTALVLLVVVLAQPIPHHDQTARFVYVLIALIALLPLLQLIPLPPAVWQALPGREIAVRISALAGLSNIYRPLSLDPDATWLSAAALLPPIAMFLATLRAGHRERQSLALIATVGALVSLFLGMMQTHGGADLYLFRWADRGLPVGLFANRNHQADFLMIGMLLISALVAARPPSGAVRSLAIGCLVVLAMGVIVTRSRTGTVLMMTASLVCAGLLINSRRTGIARLAMVIAIVAVPAVLLLTQNLVAHQTLDRFQHLEDLRPTIWRTTWLAIQNSWPFGTGFGTFVPIYQMYERLNDLDFSYVNHAHNDYLELVLEGGLPAAALFIIYLMALGSRILRPTTNPIAIVSSVAIVLILAHSLVDYPLRMSAMATTFAMLNAFLFDPLRSRKLRDTSSTPLTEIDVPPSGS
jgi:O-antigen ligase